MDIRKTDRQTDTHVDFMTDPAQRAESVNIQINPYRVIFLLVFYYDLSQEALTLKSNISFNTDWCLLGYNNKEKYYYQMISASFI